MYNDDAYDWLYEEEDEQAHDMDVDGYDGTSPTRSANVSWYCACERGRCTCDDKSRDDSNPNYNLNDTDWLQGYICKLCLSKQRYENKSNTHEELHILGYTQSFT